MKDWYASHPHLFVKRPYDHPGCDNYTKLDGTQYIKGINIFQIINLEYSAKKNLARIIQIFH
jgi:hypothetical protein